MAVRYTAIRWAREVPTLLHRGRVDRLGHHLLLLLATYAKNDGSDMYASVTSLARESHASEPDVVKALGRLKAAGLIERAHASNGAPGWSLNLDTRSEVDPVVESRRERRQAATRERTRKWRQRKAADSDSTVERHVTPESGVTVNGVTQQSGVRNAQVLRHEPVVTQDCDAGDASGSVTTAGQTGSNSLELHKDLTPKEELHPDPGPERELFTVIPASKPPAKTGNGYTPEYEAAWLAYGRRGDKRAGFTEWQKAIRRADPVVITAAISPFVESTPDMRFRKHFERWLKGDCWESAVVPASQQASNDYRPYSNPVDQSVYDEPLI